jgi:hypothetical protein
MKEVGFGVTRGPKRGAHGPIADNPLLIGETFLRATTAGFPPSALPSVAPPVG